MDFFDYILNEATNSVKLILILVVLILIAVIIYIINLEKRNFRKRKIIEEENNSLKESISELKKYNSELKNYSSDLKKYSSDLKVYHASEIGNLKKYNKIAIDDAEVRFDSYRDMVKRNYRKTFASGELILIDCFRNLLSKPGYENWNIYGHLNLTESLFNNYQIDFLIVSDKGIYVIESKMWNGVTLIYTDDYPNILSNTQFSNYGRGSNKNITVFNINDKSNSEGLEINKYTNPVEQVRKYSKILRNMLNIRIKNYVVFQQDEVRQVKFNDRDLTHYDVDKFTRITTQNKLLSDLENAFSSENIDLEKVNDFIQTKFDYTIFLNAKNVNEPPWGD